MFEKIGLWLRRITLVALTVLGAIVLAFVYEVRMDWLPINFGTVVWLVGWACVFAALTEVARVGVVSGSVVFAMVFTLMASYIFTANTIPAEYPQESERKLALVWIPTVMLLTTLRLMYNPRKKH